MRKASLLRRHLALTLGFAVVILALPVGISAQEPAGFRDFTAQVQQYLKIHHNAEAGLPPLKKTNNPEELAARGRLLADKIRELRPNAKRGEIFTDAVSVEFNRVLKSTLSAPEPRATLRAGDPVHGFEIQVNQTYPKGLPSTTVPPSLLQSLPKLPDELNYRILGSSLLLVDVPANLIVDYISDAVPQPSGK